MSTIRTLSRFFYGTTVTSSNRAIDFDEGSGELNATLRVGSYSVTEYVAEIQRAIREAGTQAYVASLDRATQKITISAPLAFDLLVSSGSRVGTSAWTMMGYTGGSDLTGLLTYTAPDIVGDRYDCQYPVFNYVSAEDNPVKENATVNETPAGIVQQVSFGDGARVEMNIRVITNKAGLKNVNFVENLSGISDARDFMTYLLTKGRVEFIPDRDTPNTFVKCYLEKTKEDSDARKFQLKNMGVPDFYETGILIFRKVLT